VKRATVEEGKAMIRLGRRAPLLVALSLFTSAATAYAECAWVLWRMDAVIPANQFFKSIAIVIEDVADTQERCKSLMSASIARSATEPDAALVTRDGVAYKHQNGEEEVRNWLCTPDDKNDPRVMLKGLGLFPWPRPAP
jgi:hypothetical protein